MRNTETRDTRSGIGANTPGARLTSAPAVPALFRSDRIRRIDRLIDYFGGPRTAPVTSLIKTTHDCWAGPAAPKRARQIVSTDADRGATALRRIPGVVFLARGPQKLRPVDQTAQPATTSATSRRRVSASRAAGARPCWGVVAGR